MGVKRVAVAANLPYYITSPVIMALLEQNLPLTSITVMVQKEAAERLTAKIPSRNVGAISYTVNYYSTPEYLFNVSRGCFMPPPNVDSAVIRFNLLKEAPVKVKSEKNFFKLIKGAFIHRRKTLVNSVSSETGIGKDKIVAALSSLNLSPTVRAEALSLEDFANLSNILF
jgi:16S rRNA (adenine1518-N6/adenine1519-N6)-dimethyltransferase